MTTSHKKPESGWQDPPVYTPLGPIHCSHIGKSLAQMAIHLHPEGHIWRCGCGAEFVVMSDDGEHRRLVLKTDTT